MSIEKEYDNQYDGDACCLKDIDQISNRGVSPHALIETENIKNR